MQTLTEKLYKDSISEIKKKFSYSNDLEVPKLKMISLNVGIKAVDSDNKFLSYRKLQTCQLRPMKKAKYREIYHTIKLLLLFFQA